MTPNEMIPGGYSLPFYTGGGGSVSILRELDFAKKSYLEFVKSFEKSQYLRSENHSLRIIQCFLL